LRHAKGTFVPTFFVPLENTRMQRSDSAKLIEMTDLHWEFFFTRARRQTAGADI